MDKFCANHYLLNITPMLTLNSLEQWVPHKLIIHNGQWLCRWLNVGDTPFSEPFFEDTISKCRSNGVQPYHSVSDIDLLPEWAGNSDAVQPSAFIFHISRCGSTLLSQLLGIQPGNIVLSEVPVFDELLRAQVSPSILKAAIDFYGQKRIGNENRLFIKTDSWHVCFYKTIRELYPGVPFILLYRDPREVLRSQQKKRGMHGVPGIIDPAIFGFDDEPQTDLDVYMARVIEHYLNLFVLISETVDNVLLVNYNQGMMNVMDKVAEYLDLNLSQEEREKMELRCKYNAKYPELVFSEAAIEPETPAYLERCMYLYKLLESIRS